MTERRRPAVWPAMAVLLLAGAGAVAQSVPFRTILVLPADNQTGSSRARIYGLAWQYLLQERLRMLPGLSTPRLGEQPAMLEKVRDNDFKVDEAAVRDEVAAAYGADVIIAPAMAGDPPDWQLSARLFEPGKGEAVATCGPVTGRDAAVVSDNLLVALLKVILRRDSVELPATADTAVDEDDLRALGGLLYRWPFTDPADADKPRENAAKTAAAEIANAGGAINFGLLVQHAVFALAAADDDAGAKRLAETYARRRMNDARAQYIWGVALAAGGDDPGAIEHFTRAANESNGAIQAVEALAAAFARRGEVDKALAQYAAAAEAWPRVPVFHLRRGELALAQRNWSEAVEAYREAVGVQPSAANLTGLARALLGAGKPADAHAVAQQLIQTAPESIDALTLAAEAALAAEAFAEARDAAAKVVAADAGNGPAQAVLGRAALALADYPAAQAALVEAVRKDPKNAELYALLADACALQDKLDDAAAVLTEGISKVEGPEQARLRLALARIEYYRANWDAGLQQVAEARKVLPDDVPAIYLEADLQLYKGDLKAAMEAYRVALEKDPGAAGPGARVLAAHAEALTGGGPASLNLPLGMLSQAAGQNREARRYYRELLRGELPAEVKAFVEEQLALVER